LTSPCTRPCAATVAGVVAAHRFLVADVADRDPACAAVGTDLGLGGRELLGLAADEHDTCAERSELVRGTATDAAAAAGDDDQLLAEQVRAEHALVGHGGSLEQALA
jgi:hypothetical protein